MSNLGRLTQPHVLRIAVLLVLIQGATLTAQEVPTSAVTGVVLQSDSDEPLEGVTVRLEPAGQSTLSDRNGRFSFARLSAGPQRVRLELLGAKVEERSVSLRPGTGVHLVVRLEVSAILLDELQVTATRSRRSVLDTPQPISVLDRALIERAQPAKVADLFAAQAGVEVQGSGPFLGLPVIRGLSGNRVLVLVDGQRLNNSREAINFGGVQPSLVDVDRIQEVEILRGPASVLYGTDALGGIVNIITDQSDLPTEGVQIGGSIRSTYSSVNDARNLSGGVRVAGSRLGLRLAGTWREADNYDSPQGRIVNSGAESIDARATLDYRPAPAHRLTLDVQRFEADDVGVPGTEGVFTGSFPFTNRSKVALAYTADTLAILGRLRVDAYVQNQEEDFATVLDLPPIPAGPFNLLIDTETERISDVRTVGVGLQAGTNLGANQHITYGVEFFRDDVDEVRREESATAFEATSPGPTPQTRVSVDSLPTTPESSFTGLGFYAQYELDVGVLRVVPGLRFDRFQIDTEPLEKPEGVIPSESRTEEAVSASLGILVRATRHIHPTLSLGRAFRTPSIIERFFFGPGSQGGLTVPNPSLGNETSLNVDVGVKIAFPAFRGSVTYFRNQIDDFITFQPASFQGQSTVGGRPVSQVQNVGDVRLQGLEATAELLVPAAGDRLVVFSTFSYTHGKELESGTPILVPPVKGLLGARWSQAPGPLSAGLVVRGVGDQDRVPEGFSGTDGFTVFDFTSSLELRSLTRKGVTLRFAVRNLTNRAYHEPLNSTLSPGRSFDASILVGF